MEKRTAMILMVAGGAFYIAGGVVMAYIITVLKGIETGLRGGGSQEDLWTAVTPIIITGFVTGLLIIIGGVLVNSENRRNRVIGGVLGIVMALLGAVNTLGGLIVGILLSIIGSAAGLTYKHPTKMPPLDSTSGVNRRRFWEIQSSPAQSQPYHPEFNKQNVTEPGWYLFQHEGGQYYWCYYDGEKWLMCKWASHQQFGEENRH